MGGIRLCTVWPGQRGRDRPRRGRGSARPRRRTGRSCSRRDRVRRRRAQEDQERTHVARAVRALFPRGLLFRPDQTRPEDGGTAAAGRRRLRPDTFHQPRLQCLLQDPDGAGDAQRHHHLAASDGQGLLGAGREADGRCSRKGRRACRHHPGHRAPEPAADRACDEVATGRRDPGDRRHADGACGLQFRQSGDRRRPGQCAGSGGRERRRRRSRQAHRRLEELRQLDPLHQ